MEQDLEYMFINALALATHSEVLYQELQGSCRVSRLTYMQCSTG